MDQIDKESVNDHVLLYLIRASYTYNFRAAINVHLFIYLF